MYLFTRRTRLAPGHGTAGVDWARSVAEKARALTGRDLRLWGTAYSAGVGTIWWTGWFETIEALERFGDALGADPAMEKLTNAATRYTEGGFDDGLGEPGYGAPPAPSTRYVAGASAVVTGCDASVLAAGTAIARKTESVTGRPTIFCRSVTGRAGAVQWLTAYDSVSTMEAARRELAGDPGWLELLDATRGASRSTAPSSTRSTAVWADAQADCRRARSTMSSTWWDETAPGGRGTVSCTSMSQPGVGVDGRDEVLDADVGVGVEESASAGSLPSRRASPRDRGSRRATCRPARPHRARCGRPGRRACGGVDAYCADTRSNAPASRTGRARWRRRAGTRRRARAGAPPRRSGPARVARCRSPSPAIPARPTRSRRRPRRRRRRGPARARGPRTWSTSVPLGFPLQI